MIHLRKRLYVLSSSIGFWRSCPGSSRAGGQSHPGQRREGRAAVTAGGPGTRGRAWLAGVLIGGLHGGTRGSRRSPHPQLMGFVIREPWVVAASFGTEGSGPTGDLGLNSDPVRVLHQKSPRHGILICKICKKAESEQNQSMSKKRLPTCRVLEERGHDTPGRSQGQLSVPQGPGICRAPLRPPGPVRRARGAPCSRLHGAQPGPLWAP